MSVSEEISIPLPPSTVALNAVCLTTPWGLYLNPGKSLSSYELETGSTPSPETLETKEEPDYWTA